MKLPNHLFLIRAALALAVGTGGMVAFPEDVKAWDQSWDQSNEVYADPSFYSPAPPPRKECAVVDAIVLQAKVKECGTISCFAEIASDWVCLMKTKVEDEDYINKLRPIRDAADEVDSDITAGYTEFGETVKGDFSVLNSKFSAIDAWIGKHLNIEEHYELTKSVIALRKTIKRSLQ